MTDTSDTYFTIARRGEAVYREKASKFIGLAFPVGSEQEINKILESVRKKYHDANHHCFAYCLGSSRETYRFNDDGEPSGSAGRPIYGQLLSKGVSDSLIIVVRYFGGTKLGIPGLIGAYRQAASEALDIAGKLEKVIIQKMIICFPYENMNAVMRIQKEEELKVIDQSFDNECRLALGVRKSKLDKVMKRFMKIQNISTSFDTVDQ